MAINELILKLQHFGISATTELPNGKWCSSEEYLALRVNGTAGLIRLLKRKIEAGVEKAKLQLALVLNDPSILCSQVEEEAHEQDA